MVEAKGSLNLNVKVENSPEETTLMFILSKPLFSFTTAVALAVSGASGARIGIDLPHIYQPVIRLKVMLGDKFDIRPTATKNDWICWRKDTEVFKLGLLKLDNHYSSTHGFL